MKITNLTVLILIFSFSYSFAQDGTYDASVTTDSGSYIVPVEVESGEVTQVHWPNGGAMTVDGAELDGGVADGTNSRGESVHIELDDPFAEYDEEAKDEAEE